MSVFFCHHCAQYIDSDVDDSMEDPNDECEMICSNCWEYYEVKIENVEVE